MPQPVTYALLDASVEPTVGTPIAEDERSHRKITQYRGLLGGRPAEQQPGHPPHRSGGNHTLAARHADPPRLQQQAIPLAGPRRVVLHSLRDILVDDHGLSPRNHWPAFAAGMALTLTERESCSEIHRQHCRIACCRGR